MQRYVRELRPTLTLAFPIIVGQVSQMLMGVTDSVMIGRTGAVALAASSFGGNVFNVFYVLGIGLMLPVSIFVARAHGARRPAECAEYLRHGVALALVFGAIETAAMAALSFGLGWFKQPPEVLAAVNPFFVLIALSLPSVLVYLALRQFAEAMGRAWTPMLIMLAGVGLNAALNWVFIYGHLGVPPLGLTGAGISTLLSRTLGAVTIYVWLRRDPAMREAWPVKWFGNYSSRYFREMLRVGFPAAGMLLFECTAFAFSSIMAGWLGTVPLAAHQIAISCASLAFMFPLGLSMATAMRVSRAVGAGELPRRRAIGFSSLGLGLALTGTFGLIFLFGGQRIASWFVSEPEVVALAVKLLFVAALFQLVDGAQVIGSACLRGITDVKIPAFITFAAYWMVALPLGYFLGIRGGYGAVGIWTGIATGLTLAAVFLGVRFARLTK
jgi:MATE family multidrug resistance protein